MNTKYKVVKVSRKDAFYDDKGVIGKIGRFENDKCPAPRGYVGGYFYPDGDEKNHYIFYGVKLEEVKE